MVYQGPIVQATATDAALRYPGLTPTPSKESHPSTGRPRNRHRRSPQTAANSDRRQQRDQRHQHEQAQRWPREPRRQQPLHCEYYDPRPTVTEPDLLVEILEALARGGRAFLFTMVVFMAIRAALYFARISIVVAAVTFTNMAVGMALLFSNAVFGMALAVAVLSHFVLTFPVLAVALGVAASQCCARRARHCHQYQWLRHRPGVFFHRPQ